MDAYQLAQRLFSMFRATEALCEVANEADIIGCDRLLMEEYRKELWVAIHDTIREFEDECFKRGLDKANLLTSR